MGRRERPIGHDGIVGAFARDLRALRTSTGSPTYRELARLAHFSDTTLSLAASGARFPSLDVTLGFVRACGGDEQQWRQRWAEAARELGRDVDARPPAAAASGPRSAVSALLPPAQLPCGVTAFTGRAAELAELDGLARRGAARGQGTIVLITGAPGVGKTALALHWAHQVAGQFPGGQLYIDLRGFDPTSQPATRAEAISSMLDAYEVSPERIPVSLTAQAGLYRSLLAGQRVLVVLDNARDADQVRDLLPGSSGCLTLITSRNQLASLVVAEGGWQVSLDLPTEAEAVEMLGFRLGQRRMQAERDAVAEITSLCGRLPLALAIVAREAVIRPGLPLASIAAQLQDTRRLLDVLDGGEPLASARAVFSWSYQNLRPAAARLFRLIGLHPGPDISAAAAASLAGLPVAETTRILGDLVDGHLLTELTAGRFSCHDLLRAYAAEQASRLDDEAERRAALCRVLDHYLHTGLAAAAQLFPGRERIMPGPIQPGVTPEDMSDHDQAQRWFAAEYRVMLAATATAAEAGFDVHAWQLPWTLVNFLDRQGHWHEWAEILPTALAAARRCGDRAAQAMTHRNAGRVCIQLGNLAGARVQLRQAVRLFSQLDDLPMQARGYLDLGVVAEHLGSYEEALRHSERSMELFAQIGDKRAHARAAASVGWLFALLGGYEQAISYCEQAAGDLREAGDTAGEAGAIDSLGYAHMHLGNHPVAVACFRKALALAQETGQRLGQGEALNHLGDAQLAMGDPGSAQESWRRALALLTELRHRGADQVREKLERLGSGAEDEPPIARPRHRSAADA